MVSERKRPQQKAQKTGGHFCIINGFHQRCLLLNGRYIYVKNSSDTTEKTSKGTTLRRVNKARHPPSILTIAPIYILVSFIFLLLKEPLIKSHNFWQRLRTGIKAWSCRKAHCLSNGHNADTGFLAKPHRARLQGIISVVALLVNAISIPCEVRLKYDAL